MPSTKLDRRAVTSPINGLKGGGAGGPVGPRGPQLATRARADAVLAHAKLSAANIAEQMARGAFFDVGHLYNDDGSPKPLSELEEWQRSMIVGVEVVLKNAAAGDGVVDRVLKYKIEPRSKYVELAAKYRGMLVEQIDVRVIEAGTNLEKARARARARNHVIDVTPTKVE